MRYKMSSRRGMKIMSLATPRLEKQRSLTMKRTILAIALLTMGGASLSTVSTASAMPAAASISQAAQADGALQLVGGWRHNKFFFGHHRGFHKGRFHGKRFKWYPRGYYRDFCYDYPYHWWCKKYFFKKFRHY
jgi:hypothetical protein